MNLDDLYDFSDSLLEPSFHPAQAGRRSACWECPNLGKDKNLGCRLPCPKVTQRLMEWGERPVRDTAKRRRG